MSVVAEIIETIRQDNLDAKTIHRNHIKKFLEKELKKRFGR